MINIVVCIKLVPAIDYKSGSIQSISDLRSAEYKINPFDLSAIDLALSIAGKSDSIIALTIGGPQLEQSKLQKDILSRGPDRLIGIRYDSELPLDCYNTAKLLQNAIEELGDVELVICGEGSEDLYQQQVGNILGGLLKRTTVNGISAVQRCGDRLQLTREVEDAVTLLSVSTPAVISAISSPMSPNLPDMAAVMAAGRKRVEIHSVCDADSASNILSRQDTFLRKSKRMKRIMDASDVEAFVIALKKHSEM